ncbi:MAG: DMT family transporter [Candidatus Bathyarchaeota archaeon]|nr:MAG: DMT family transporter [Candidatus Bathyarchaeota archaeon]
MSSAPPLAIATYRLVFATLILLPFYINSGGPGRLLGAPRKDLLSLVGVGVVLALHFASWITSLSFTSVASSVIFVHVDPIFVAAVAHFVFKERVGRETLPGIVVAFIGATIIAFGDSGMGELNLYGDALALVGAVMLGLYILSGRRLRQSLDLVSYVTPVYATSAVVLTLGSLATRTPLAPYPPEEYALFLAIAVVPMIFGHTVYNWALRYIEASVVSISLLGEPVGATILAFLFLREAPSAMTILGGAITLLGIYQCVKSSS